MRQTELDSLKAEYVSEVRDAWARVAVGSEHVRQQQHRVSEKKMRGQQASLSEALLETFRETQQLQTFVRAVSGRTARSGIHGALALREPARTTKVVGKPLHYHRDKMPLE